LRRRSPASGLLPRAERMGWCAHLSIDELGAVGRDDIAVPTGRSPLAGDGGTEAIATVARKRAPTQGRAHGLVCRDDIAAPGPVGARLRATEGPRPSRRSPASGLLPRAERMGWCAHLSIDELGAVGRDDIAVPGPVGARLRATEGLRPSRRSPASGLLPRAERMGWCAHLSIDELGAVSRDDIAALGSVGARLRATESPRPSRRSPASGLLPRAERMGWCAHLLINELGAVGRDDIAVPGPVGARLRATEGLRPSRRSPASGLLPRAERMGWCAHLSIDELGAVSRDDIAALGPVGARLRATERPRPSRRSPASGLLPRAERMGWCAGLSIDELAAVGRDDSACCRAGVCLIDDGRLVGRGWIMRIGFWRRRRNHPCPERLFDQLGRVLDGHLDMDVPTMGLDGAGFDTELPGDLFVEELLAQQQQHLEFSRGQLIGQLWSFRVGSRIRRSRGVRVPRAIDGPELGLLRMAGQNPGPGSEAKQAQRYDQTQEREHPRLMKLELHRACQVRASSSASVAGSPSSEACQDASASQPDARIAGNPRAPLSGYPRDTRSRRSSNSPAAPTGSRSSDRC
jgi:hypothetical protein